MQCRSDDVIVVGSGIGGLSCALSLAPRSVTLLTKTPQLQGGSSLWAQGGIAAAVGPEDSPQAHAADTISAGAGLSHFKRTQELTEEGAASLQWLIDEGIPFDRDLQGALSLAKEAAHQFPRVVHAGGDATGQVLVTSLVDRVRAAPAINIVEGAFVHDLLVHDGRVQGLLAFDEDNGWVRYNAPQIVLATGGVGMAWRDTTNPDEATGDGLAIAARAGAKLANLEFVQFHPTALAVKSSGRESLPLLTEALRGAGALLLDEAGERFMLAEHRLAELAPRDVVARAIHKRTRCGERVFLDLRPVLGGNARHAFPQAVATAAAAGLDPFKSPLPVVPAAHYHMGGIEVDGVGRTSIMGLWACGEVASTGIHGANRLASNSLLEALVYARKVAAQIQLETAVVSDQAGVSAAVPHVADDSTNERVAALVDDLRDIMSKNVGILRNGSELEQADVEISRLVERLRQLQKHDATIEKPTLEQVKRWGESRNLLLVARLIAIAALRREESRGAHYRDDYPLPRAEWRRQQSLTAASLFEAHG